MKAIILARVSTEEQMTEGQSIPAQLEKARDYAKRKELTVLSEYQFDESSIKDKRVKFDQVIAQIKRCKSKIALIVETVDRLQRSFKESVMLDEHRKSGKLELHFIRENLVIHQESNSSEIQRWDLAVFVAKSFVLQISDNVKRTIEKKIRNGECPSMAPVGYKNTEDEKGNKTIIIDPVRGHLIKRVFDLYATGLYSMKKIAQIMDEEGLTGKHKVVNTIKPRRIESILKNPFYYGEMLHKGKLYPHKYEPLVPYDIWKKCKDVRLSYDKTVKNTEKPFIFIGKIKCARCGCSITAEFKKNRFVYYHCTNYYGNCKKVYVPQEKILMELSEIFRGLVLPEGQAEKLLDNLKKLEKSKNVFLTEQLEALKTEWKSIDYKLKVMYEDRLEGRITTEEYDKLIVDYKEREYNLKFKIAQLSNARFEYYKTAGYIITIAQNAHKLFENASKEQKRQLLNLLVSNLKLDGKKLEYKLKNPFDRVLISNTRHNWGPLCDTFRTFTSNDFEEMHETFRIFENSCSDFLRRMSLDGL
jgi:site-specific DNA recombinase